jgi:purine-nucleoside phosphorylase
MDINPDMVEIAPLNVFQRATEAAQYIRTSLPPSLRNPRVGIICGSGLGGLADAVHPEPKHGVAYSDIPHFPKVTGMSIRITICDKFPGSL